MPVFIWDYSPLTLAIPLYIEQWTRRQFLTISVSEPRFLNVLPQNQLNTIEVYLRLINVITWILDISIENQLLHALSDVKINMYIPARNF